MEFEPLEYFTVAEVSKLHKIPKSTVKYRCQRLMINPIIHFGRKTYVLCRSEIEAIVNYSFLENVKVPEIIYVTRTTEIYESKLNYLNENQL